MGRLLQLVLLVPIGIALIVFGVANRQAVIVSLDPFTPDDPSLALSVPLFMLIFAVLLIGVLVGGIAAWVSQGSWRAEARTSRAEARRWRARADEIEARRKADAPAETPGLPVTRAAR